MVTNRLKKKSTNSDFYMFGYVPFHCNYFSFWWSNCLSRLTLVFFWSGFINLWQLFSCLRCSRPILYIIWSRTVSRHFCKQPSFQFSSVHSLSRDGFFLFCPSPTPKACSYSSPLSQWCHPTISFSSSPSPPAFNRSQHQGLFQWVSSSHQVAKVLEFQLQHQSFQWIFRTDFL